MLNGKERREFKQEYSNRIRHLLRMEQVIIYSKIPKIDLDKLREFEDKKKIEDAQKILNEYLSKEEIFDLKCWQLALKMLERGMSLEPEKQ